MQNKNGRLATVGGYDHSLKPNIEIGFTTVSDELSGDAALSWSFGSSASLLHTAS
jgi:hypothetical protein